MLFAVTLVLGACGDGSSGGLPTDPPQQPGPITPPGATSALSGVRLWVPPSPAQRQANEWRTSRAADAAQMEKIADQPQAVWFGDWTPDVREAVRGTVSSAGHAAAWPVVVAYNIPQRDCGGLSGGSQTTPDGYRSWIRAFAAGIGDLAAIVILEPDALALADCLDEQDRQLRYDLLLDAVRVLKGRPRTRVYIDAGHARWHSPDEIAARLRRVGIAEADGFSLNVSNFFLTEENVRYGRQVSERVGGRRFVIDTSRNGLGPTSDSEWCNPPGRALGPRPTTSPPDPHSDAYLWIKTPGESDGACNGGPVAGAWWPEYALELARRAAY